MSAKQLNFAVIGCGRIAEKRHLPLLQELEQAKLVAVCDTIEERAARQKEKYRVAAYTDYHEMLAAHPEIDVVLILTPSGHHAECAVEVARYKKHVVVEKPMALALDDSDKMIRACDESGVKLFVVKQNRYNYPVQKLREAIESHRFGKLVLGSVRVRWCRPQAYYDQDSWRGTWAWDGGVLTNQASHHIDLLEWMMGDVESVIAKTATRLVDIEVEDTGVAILKFRNGALGIIEATTATRPKDLEGSISILGERGTVEIGGFAMNEMKVWNFVDQQPGDEDVLAEYRQNPPDVYGFGHRQYLQNVIEVILHRDKAIVDGLEGRKSLELINAIYESAETGREVSLRFKPQKCKLGMKNG
ncbi:MAG: Gfo/Idh/MocA family oxidoreductase [Calditrichaeota bacterium]|nr:Gfo/Idh/MocA family oxidoreductase [Calditrichota bacterium]MCB0294175.1 Gfo/Idh/MocA family oxidoreductase [Calditrichota bacterium]MCB0302244.1 Gfo/Idh/MocA family oxidoreductase [Calditrichota bacterium]MCB0313199.1 Gfo/Idh/MocA family oxidoreductase [Calditrichota bacterium]MCB9087715.1 Gfo/Idh/MocA family oxidoreductase [Calditrichia bacterium]